MREILFIKTSSLGDVIHHMPAIADVRRHAPDARVSWLVEEAFAPLARLHPGVARVIPVAWRRWRKALLERDNWSEIAEFCRQLRGQRFDLVIDTQGLMRSAAMARVARGRRHGYAFDSVREPLASLAYDVRHRVSRDLHAIARNRALTAKALGYEPTGAPAYGLNLQPPQSAAPYAMLLHASAQRSKEWPQENWVAAGRSLVSHGLIPVLPWGTREEKSRAERIAAALPTARIPERQELDSLAGLIAGARAAIGVDTGLLHLAAACAVPLVAIFVASEPGLTGPIGAGAIEVVGKKGQPPSAAEVVDALANVLDSQR